MLLTMEATPGIEIQGKRLRLSRLASDSQSITQLQLPRSRLSPVFPLSVHGVVPNSYQIDFMKLMAAVEASNNSELHPRGVFEFCPVGKTTSAFRFVRGGNTP